MSERHLSQSELARRVGVTQTTIRKLVSGAGYGSKHLHVIARELGTTPAYLNGETDDPLEDAPAPPMLSHDELEWIDLYRRMDETQRRSALTFLRGMIDPTPASSATLHSPKRTFEARPESI